MGGDLTPRNRSAPLPALPPIPYPHFLKPSNGNHHPHSLPTTTPNKKKTRPTIVAYPPVSLLRLSLTPLSFTFIVLVYHFVTILSPVPSLVITLYAISVTTTQSCTPKLHIDDRRPGPRLVEPESHDIRQRFKAKINEQGIPRKGQCCGHCWAQKYASGISSRRILSRSISNSSITSLHWQSATIEAPHVLFAAQDRQITLLSQTKSIKLAN